MAATGFTPVYIYASGTTGNIPSASNLTNTTTGSEIALNYFDGKLFYKNASNSVVTVPLLQSSGSQNGWLSSTDWATFNGKAPSFTYTTGYIPFGQGTTTPNQSSNLFWDNANSRLGIGSNTPDRTFYVYTPVSSGLIAGFSNGYTNTNFYISASPSGGQVILNASNNAQTAAQPLAFAGNGSEWGRFHSSGGVSIGNTTDPGAGALNVTGNTWVGSNGDLLGANRRMSVYGQVAATFKSQDSIYVVVDVWNPGTSGDNTFQIFFTETSATARGSITYNRAGGLVAYNTTSDYRAKTIIGDVTNSGEVIDALKVYDGIMNGATVSRPMLVAHEAQEITPYAVTGEKDAVNEDGTPKLQQMDVSAYVPLLIAEIQQLRKRVADLEKK